MADTKTKQDIEDAANEAKAKATETLDAAAQTAQTAKDAVKSIFSKALDEAKAAAVSSDNALSKKAHEQGEIVKDKLAAADLVGEAKALGSEAKARAAVLAVDGKAKASDALTGLGKIVADNASVVDDKLGEKYGDYARSAARTIQETAAKLESKDLSELGDEAKTLVRKSPLLALGIAAVAGYLIARTLKSSSSDEA